MIKDIRFAIRQLRRNPGFAVLAIVTLALGIGANTAMFTVTDSVLVRPLPYAHADRLVQIGGKDTGSTSWVNYRDITQQASSIESSAAYMFDVGIIHDSQGGETIFTPKITSTLLPLLGVHPILGRGFTEADCQPGAAPVVLLSASIWKQRFNSDRDVVGRQVQIGKVSYNVIGVLPQGFTFPAEGEDVNGMVWMPVQPTAEMLKDRGANFLLIAARLKPGAGIGRLRSELGTVAQRIRTAEPEHKGTEFSARSLQDVVTASVRPVFLALTGALVLVLLIACVNVANLQLARCLSRQQELAIRLAIGASRARLLRQLLIEGAILCAAGAIVGLGLVGLILQGLRKLPAGLIPRADEIHVNLPVLGAVVLIAAVCTLLSSLMPALWASRTSPQASMKSTSGSVSGGRARVSAWLVAGEVSLATLLLLGSGLMFRTLYNLEHRYLGFETAHLFTFTATPPDSAGFFGGMLGQKEEKPDQTSVAVTAYAPLLERLRHLPGVANATLVSARPLEDIDMNSSFHVVGTPKGDDNENHAQIRTMSGNYLAVLGTPIVRGRPIADSDNAAAPFVMVVNEAFARKYFPNQDPVGKQLDLGGKDTGMLQPYTIVGVIGNAVQHGMTQEPQPEMDLPYQQIPPSSLFYPIIVKSLTNFVLKTSSGADQTQAVRNVFRDQAPGFALDDFQTMERTVESATFNQRLGLYLIAAFAGLAVIMVMAGLYGVLSQLVGQRRREIGVRMALGADRRSILALIVRRGSLMIAGGLLVGVIAGLAAGRLVTSFLYGVKPADFLTYLGVSAALLVIGLLASWLPAHRAASIEPMQALRAE